MLDLLFMEQALIISKHHHTTGQNLVQPVSVGMSNQCLKLFFSPSKAEGIFTVHNSAIINKQNAFM